MMRILNLDLKLKSLLKIKLKNLLFLSMLPTIYKAEKVYFLLLTIW